MKRMHTYLNISFILFISGIHVLHGQPTENLTLPQAIEYALKNNYNIQIVNLQNEITKLQNHPGNASMLPTASGNIYYNKQINTSDQQYFNGDSKQASNANSTAFDASANANWIIFDGLKMFAIKERLEQLVALGELQLHDQMEQTLFTVMTNWYTLIQLNYAGVVITDAMKTTHELLSLAKAKENYGAGSRLDILQAQVNLNADSSQYLNIQSQIADIKTELNRLMGRDPKINFNIQEKIVVDESLSVEEIINKSANRNTGILMAQKNKEIAELQIKEYKSYVFPTVSLFGAYTYTYYTSEIGFLKSNISYGPNYGVTLSVPLFNGLTASKNIETMKVAEQINNLKLQQTQLDVNALIISVYNQYRTSINLIKLGKNDIEAAGKTVEIALEKFKLGTITSIELREIQQTQIDAENRLLAEQLNAKLAELQLKKLSGELLD